MIIDVHAMHWQELIEFCRSKMIVDAVTGECLDSLSIFYADTDHGIIRRHALDGSGMPILNPAKDEIEWVEESRAIAVVDRPGSGDGCSS